MRSIVSISCLLVLLLAATAWGQEFVITVPGDCGTITAAVQAASNKMFTDNVDVLINVKRGTYEESVDLNPINNPNHRVTLHALEGQSKTVIDVSDLAANGYHFHALMGNNVQNFTLDGFTVRNRYTPDPSNPTEMKRGLSLNNSTHITVQNCFFDTRGQAMMFNITNPSVTSEATVVHNTVITGEGTDPNKPEFFIGQAVNMTYIYYYGPGCEPLDESGCNSVIGPPPPPTGNHKMIVTDNVLRSNGSPVRYVFTETKSLADGTQETYLYPNGSLVMTGNDLVANQGAGHNIIGGHGHLIAGNRFHDSTAGAQIQGGSGGIIENNLFINNITGLLIGDMPITSEPTSGALLVRNNTIVNNSGAGIVYNATYGASVPVPNIYNNIVAYNNASGIASVGMISNQYSFIPVDFQLARNDLFGNTLQNLNQANSWFDFVGISNPKAATKNYAGPINTSLDIFVNPIFANMQSGDFSLGNGSSLIDAGITSRAVPSSDFARNLRDSNPDIGAFEFIKTSGKGKK